jgi:hypothetical protein
MSLATDNILEAFPIPSGYTKALDSLEKQRERYAPEVFVDKRLKLSRYIEVRIPPAYYGKSKYKYPADVLPTIKNILTDLREQNIPFNIALVSLEDASFISNRSIRTSIGCSLLKQVSLYKHADYNSYSYSSLYLTLNESMDCLFDKAKRHILYNVDILFLDHYNQVDLDLNRKHDYMSMLKEILWSRLDSASQSTIISVDRSANMSFESLKDKSALYKNTDIIETIKAEFKVIKFV